MEYRLIVQRCIDDAKTFRAQPPEVYPLNLYCAHHRLLLVSAHEPAPAGYALVKEHIINSGTPFDHWFSMVYNQAPIL